MTANYLINNHLFNYLLNVGPLSFPQFFTITRNAISLNISSRLFTRNKITGSGDLLKFLKHFFYIQFNDSKYSYCSLYGWPQENIEFILNMSLLALYS